MKIAFGITGAGHLLTESVELMEKLNTEHDVTVLLSGAGEEVLKMYGLFERVKKMTGGYYNELVLEKDQKFSFPLTGRFSLGKYDLLIVSPTTSNTIGKIVNGIADSLVTNAVAQAGKGRVKTILVPVDIESGDLETVLPSKLELDQCQKCEVCDAA
ncbi:MAG: flavoprotein, partial [Methanobacterium sp.]